MFEFVKGFSKSFLFYLMKKKKEEKDEKRRATKARSIVVAPRLKLFSGLFDVMFLRQNKKKVKNCEKSIKKNKNNVKVNLI